MARRAAETARRGVARGRLAHAYPETRPRTQNHSNCEMFQRVTARNASSRGGNGPSCHFQPEVDVQTPETRYGAKNRQKPVACRVEARDVLVLPRPSRRQPDQHRRVGEIELRPDGHTERRKLIRCDADDGRAMAA